MKRPDARERGEGRRGRRFVGEVLADLERAAELEARYADTWQRRLGELDDMGIQ